MITKEQLFSFADYEIRALNEDCFILERKGSVQSDKLITLNKTAAYVWNHLLGRVFSIETVASLLSIVCLVTIVFRLGQSCIYCNIG